VNIYMASYQAVSILHGGPLTQMRSTASSLEAHGIGVRYFDPWSRFSAAPGDMVHLFGANIGTYHLAREIHALGTPFVVSPILFSRHSPFFLRMGKAATRLAQRLGPGIWSDYGLTADICTWAARVLPNTRAEAQLISEGLGVPAGKVTVIPNGVEERFGNASPDLFVEKYGVKDFILTVGHTGHERKNVLRLIRALATIDHPAVIIGRIIKSAYGEACVREASRHKHILLIDGMDHQSELLASAYAACDVFVLPSLFETPGIAALEAALAGAKVAITPYGGTAEYFGSFATYVEPTSVESIREGILKELSKPKDPALQARVRENYLWSAVAAQTAAVYRAVSSSLSRTAGELPDRSTSPP
jgi:glycosyltransferase involved in cell wall biosynthesis